MAKFVTERLGRMVAAAPARGQAADLGHCGQQADNNNHAWAKELLAAVRGQLEERSTTADRE